MSTATITRESLLQTNQFKKYIESLKDPNVFLEKLGSESSEFMIRLLQKIFPSDFTEKRLVSSLLLNLQQDYNSIITDLPQEFHAREANFIHAGNTNQIDVHYTGEIRKGEEPSNRLIACVSLHFRDIDGNQFMYLENVQGELREGERTRRREVRRVYGKLNSHFGEDWRPGLLRQAVEYAHSHDMKIKGQVPGIFVFLGTSLAEYPMYTLNYVRTYLSAGVPLENIELKHVPYDEIKNKWNTAIDFLRTKSHADRLRLLALAAGEYTEAYANLFRQCFREKKIRIDAYERGCEIEFSRVFDKYLS